MDEEIWKKITDFEDYEISNLGNIKSNKKKNSKLLKQGTAINGYKQVTLCNDNCKKLFKVHQLVAFEFLNHKPFKESKLVINHKNNNRQDNRLYNLEITTYRDNNNKKNDIYKSKYSSQYAGVSFSTSMNKFKSGININKKTIHLGYYESEIEAHNFYLKAIEIIDEYDGNNLNFRRKLGVKEKKKLITERTGVYLRSNNKYTTCIYISNTYCNLGTFEKKEEAIKIRNLAEQNKSKFNGDRYKFKEYIHSLYDLTPMEIEDLKPKEIVRY